MGRKASAVVIITCLMFVKGDDWSFTRQGTRNNPMSNVSIQQVDARLATEQMNTGVIQVLLSGFRNLQTICYPAEAYEYEQAVLLSHVVCRHLGHMTSGSRYKQSLVTGQESLRTTSAQCSGSEQSIAHCPWSRVQTSSCRSVLATECTSCSQVVKAASGLITSPGYPYTYVFSVLCEWTVIVPEEYWIELTFNHFFLPHGNKISLDCTGGSYPYVEVTYGEQRFYSIFRYCDFNSVSSLRVPRHQAVIRFFSGLPTDESRALARNYGFSISFRARPQESSNFQAYKILIISCVFLFFFVLVSSCYFCRRWEQQNRRQRNETRSVSRPNALPTSEQLQMAYEVRRNSLRSQPLTTFHRMTTEERREETPASRRSVSSLPVVSALAPAGPTFRKVSNSTTPLTVIPEILAKGSKGSRAQRMCIERLKTRLLNRFSTSNNEHTGLHSVEIYQSPSDDCFTSRRSSSREDKLSTKSVSSNSQQDHAHEVPSIVVQFVNSSTEGVVVGVGDS